MVLLLLGFSFVFPLLYFIFFKVLISPRKLPPGPFSWPLLGTPLPNTGKPPHVQMSDMAKTYGPLMLLKYGTESVVVATTHTAAKEVLKNHDREFTRYAPHCTCIKGYMEHSMVWADYTDHWKMMRKMSRTELFSTKMLDAQSHVREGKVAELVQFIMEKKEGRVMENFADLMFGASVNILGGLLFGKNVHDYEEDEDSTTIDRNHLPGIKATIKEMILLAVNPDNLADLYPKIFGNCDIQGLRKAVERCYNRLNESWAPIVKERRADKTGSHLDFLQVLIDAGCTDQQIYALILVRNLY